MSSENSMPMKTTLEVDDLLSPLGGRGLENHLSDIAGVHRASLNDASGGVSVMYDPAVLGITEIRALVQACGYHCSGEIVPKHVCSANGAPAAPPSPARSNGLAASSRR